MGKPKVGARAQGEDKDRRRPPPSREPMDGTDSGCSPNLFQGALYDPFFCTGKVARNGIFPSGELLQDLVPQPGAQPLVSEQGYQLQALILGQFSQKVYVQQLLQTVSHVLKDAERGS